MQINYQAINSNNLEKIIPRLVQNTEWDEQTLRKHIHLENGSFSLVALCDDVPAGLISTYTKKFTSPLGDKKDAYIDILEVGEQYRRQGIAKNMIDLTEKWAKENGFLQIRSWSSEDKTEAIPMWYALQYCMCPAKLWLARIKESVDGYYVVKKLNPTMK